jgi:hypothetical protein
MLHMAELLLHSNDVPVAARVALSSALAAPSDQRRPSLYEAARILHRDGGLACEDALELVGLSDDGLADDACGCDG